MADDIDDEDTDNEDTDNEAALNESDEQGAIPTGSQAAAPSSEDEQPQSQYQNPMANAPRPGPGSHLISDILAFARAKFGLDEPTPEPQPAIPTDETPGELGPEAKKYIQEGKETGPLENMGSKLQQGMESLQNIQNIRPSDIGGEISRQVSAVPGQLAQAGRNIAGIITPQPAAGSIAAEGTGAMPEAQQTPLPPQKPDALKQAQGAAKASTLAAIEHANNPNGTEPAPVVAQKNIEYATDKGGMDAGLGILQRYRRNYDIARAFANVALDNDNMTSAIDAANRAYRNVPGNSSVVFTQGGNGNVSALVTNPVGRTDQYMFSPTQFAQLLAGPQGEFDNLLGKGNTAGIEALGFRPPAPKIIKREQEDTEAAKDERKANLAERIERIKGTNQIAREHAKGEDIQRWKQQQIDQKDRSDQLKAEAKRKDLDTILNDDLREKARRGASDKELDVYRRQFNQIYGRTPAQANAPQKQQPQQGVPEGYMSITNKKTGLTRLIKREDAVKMGLMSGTE